MQSAQRSSNGHRDTSNPHKSSAQRSGAVRLQTAIVQDHEKEVNDHNDEDEPNLEDDEVFVSFLWEGSHVARAGIAMYSKGEFLTKVTRHVFAAPLSNELPVGGAHFVSQISTRQHQVFSKSQICDLLSDSVAGSGDIAVCSCPCPETDLGWLINTVKQVAGSPAAILTSSNISEAGRAEMATKQIDGSSAMPTSASGPVQYNETGSNLGGAIPVHVLRQGAFSMPAALAVLSRLTTAEMSRRSQSSTTHCSSDAALRLGSMIDMTDTMAIRAMGALVQWLAGARIISDNMQPSNVAGGRANSEADDRPAQRRRIHEGSSPDLLVIPGAIRSLALGHFMQVDALTFAALQVFAPQVKGHGAATTAAMAAASFSGRSGVKEGFSLCALLDRTMTPSGSRLLRNWIRRPSTDIATLQHRHDAVAFLITARQQAPEVWRDLKRALRKVKDVPRTMLRMQMARATSGDWWVLEQTLIGAGVLRDHLMSLLVGIQVPAPLFAPSATALAPGLDPMDESTPSSAQAPTLVRQLLSLADPSSPLASLLSIIQQVIDWPASRGRGERVVVQSGLDVTLDEHRRIQSELPELLARETDNEMALYTSLASASLRYVPQIGVMLAVDKRANGLGTGGTPLPGTAMSDSGQSHSGMTPRPVRPMLAGPQSAIIPEEFDLQYETAEELCFKTPRCRTMDAYFGDLDSAIHNMEASILRQLEDRVLSMHEGQLLVLGEGLAQIDVLCSLAEASGDNGWTRPLVVSEPVLLAKNARHPLQELVLTTGAPAFVPNDIALAPGRPGAGPIAILTGPNGSGKSVYLKLVGLIPIMAQIGCFVPADKVIFGPVDRLFTRIASLESASVAASTFAIDVQQVGCMLRHSTPNSLLLIDELGKGTNSVDGVALLAASIRAILASGESSNNSPKTVIATHFRELLDLGLLSSQYPGGPAVGAGDPPAGVSFFKMEVMLDSHTPGKPTAVKQLDMGGSLLGADSSRSDAGGQQIERAEWDEIVVPLFKLKTGRADSSYGFACASKAGIPAYVVERAHDVSLALCSGMAVTPLADCPAWQRSKHIATPAVQARTQQSICALKAAHWIATFARESDCGQDGNSGGDKASRALAAVLNYAGQYLNGAKL